MHNVKQHAFFLYTVITKGMMNTFYECHKHSDSLDYQNLNQT